MKKITDNQLEKIWDQLPPNYYENGEKNNIGQFLWHNNKRRIISKIFDTIRNKLITKNLSIMDLGCANGHNTMWLKKKWPKAKIYGIDVVKKLIQVAIKKYPNIKFICADAHKLPFKSNTFDLIICTEVLEHLKYPTKVIVEMKRVLKNGGYAIIELDTGNWLFSILWFYWERYGNGKVWRNAHLHQFNQTKLKKIILKNKLEIVNVTTHNLSMAVSILCKKKSSI